MESSPECASSLTTPFSTQSSGPPLTPPNYVTLESWERRWLMSFNGGKCHQLTVIKKRNRIPASYTLYNQTFKRVASAEYLGAELTENLHWGKHIQSTAAKANKVSTFAYTNLQGCSPAVQMHCYNGLVRPVLKHHLWCRTPISNI